MKLQIFAFRQREWVSDSKAFVFSTLATISNLNYSIRSVTLDEFSLNCVTFMLTNNTKCPSE